MASGLQDHLLHAYWRLPIRLQEAALSVYARHLDRIYFGAAYHRWREHFQVMRTWLPADVQAWQEERLRKVLTVAFRHVPYYRQLAAANTSTEEPLATLARLPRLDRHLIRRREAEFVDERLDRRRLFTDKTSGSTGTALTTYWARESQQMLWAAFEVFVRDAAGVAKDTPRAMLGGRLIVRGDTDAPPYWRYNRYWKQLYLSSYHVSRRSAPGYIEAIRRHRSVWLTGYGSAIAALAHSASEAGVPPLPLRCVVVSGDTLQPGMRHSIESFFRCRCYDSYGQVEGVAMAMECGGGRMHLVPPVGIVEILRADGTACLPGEVGEIVATGLLNENMPFLRYRTGDLAAWALDQSCKCGSAAPVIDALEGRTDDYLVGTDGRRIGRLSTAIKKSPSIHSAQLVQRSPGSAVLLVRPDSAYQRADGEAVVADILTRIGTFELRIVEVEEIPKTPKGKTNLVVRLDEHPELAPAYEAVGLGQ